MTDEELKRCMTVKQFRSLSLGELMARDGICLALKHREELLAEVERLQGDRLLAEEDPDGI